MGANGNEQLLNLNQAKVDQLVIDGIGAEFIQGSEHRVYIFRLRQFGKFTWTCLYIATCTYWCTRILHK